MGSRIWSCRPGRGWRTAPYRRERGGPGATKRGGRGGGGGPRDEGRDEPGAEPLVRELAHRRGGARLATTSEAGLGDHRSSFPEARQRSNSGIRRGQGRPPVHGAIGHIGGAAPNLGPP